MAVRQSPADGDALLRAKALSTPSRVRILDRLHRASTPLTAADLAQAMGMHHTAVREHLALLIGAGMVRGEGLPVIGRGRPRTGYVVVARPEPAEAYRTLASMLADAVRGGLTARTAGRQAGAMVPVSADGAVATLRDEAQRLGFEPTVRVKGQVHELVLTSCPFGELAAQRPETVCDVHLGIAEGVCERVGGAVVEGIRLADPRKGGCRITMRVTPAPMG
ncbi:MAG: helix-turn-helix domain-containing protein [Actinomycetota bacterium]|nr:helix-turn-helix domain-containing protein [Actinomycetota bacterium]